MEAELYPGLSIPESGSVFCGEIFRTIFTGCVRDSKPFRSCFFIASGAFPFPPDHRRKT
jgi:hypothetical protein